MDVVVRDIDVGLVGEVKVIVAEDVGIMEVIVVVIPIFSELSFARRIKGIQIPRMTTVRGRPMITIFFLDNFLKNWHFPPAGSVF